METIDTSQVGWQKRVHAAMERAAPFMLVTGDLEWRPDSSNPLDVAKWMWGSSLPGWVATLLMEHNIGLGSYARTVSPPAADGGAGAGGGEGGGGAGGTTSGAGPGGGATSGPDTVFIAGAGGLMLLGAGMILLAFFDPEPTSKLTLLVGGGIAALLGGGFVLAMILVMRSRYIWDGTIDPKTGKMRWNVRPAEDQKR